MFARFAVFLACWLPCLATQGETAFWVWNRHDPLSAQEKIALAAAGVKTLYWHFAEIENKAGVWAWKRSPHLAEKTSSALRIVPVLRLEASVKEPFAGAARAQLREKTIAAFAATGAEEWQLDYDAPDRLVGAYADFLKDLRSAAPKLSSTALAGWVRLPAFEKLRGSVSELCPMFYDLTPDTADALLPLLETASTQALLAEWTKRCDLPWRAGLPWFARLTVYGTDGKSRGHFRQWSWDDVIFRRALHVEKSPGDGITVLQAVEPTVLGRSSVRKGERLVLRWPDLAALAATEKAAARDLIYFRLPDPQAASSGWSLSQFADRHAGRMGTLVLRREGEALVLENQGPGDLPPRIEGDGPQDRGYAVEVEGEGPIFREALAGDFWRVGGHIQPDAAHPRSAPVGLATRLTFWFSALPAGQSLKSGLFQLTPPGEAAPLRYRILNPVEKAPWTPLENSH